VVAVDLSILSSYLGLVYRHRSLLFN